MANSDPLHSNYTPQFHFSQDDVDAHLMESTTVPEEPDSSLGKAVLYSRWSVLTDEVEPSVPLQSTGFYRPQSNLVYPGNGPDVSGTFSSVLEGTNGTERFENWSSSELFPLCLVEYGQVNQEDKIMLNRNGFSDAVDINIYQDAFEQLPKEEEGKLYQDFHDLNSLCSRLEEDPEHPEFSSFEPTFLATASRADRIVIHGSSLPRTEAFCGNRKEFGPSVQRDCKNVYGCSFGKTPGATHAFHNRSNSNNTRLCKELSMERNGVEVMGLRGYIEDAGLSGDLRSRDKWTEQRQKLSSKIERQVHSTLWKSTSLSQSYHGPKYSKVNRNSRKQVAEGPSLNRQDGYPPDREPYGQCQWSSFDFSQGVTTEIQSTEHFQPENNGRTWSRGDIRSPVGREGLWYRRNSSSGGNSQPSLSYRRNSSSKVPCDHLLNTGFPLSYPSPTPVISPDRRQDQQGRFPKGVSCAWPKGRANENRGMNFPSSHSVLDSSRPERCMYSPATGRSQHRDPSGWRTPVRRDDPERFCFDENNHSPVRCEDRRSESGNTWFHRANVLTGQNRAHHSIQGQSRQPLHSVPPFLVLTQDVRGSLESDQLDLHAAGSRKNSGLFQVPPSVFSFPDLMDALQAKDLSFLSDFTDKLLGGGVPAPLQPPPFGLPPFYGRNHPVRNHSSPPGELHVQLEVCYEQWRALGKERKQTEAKLAKSFPGMRVISANGRPVPALPANPSRVDRLVVDQLREHHKVLTLIGVMECVRGALLHSNISSTLDRHLDAIHLTQSCRQDEVINATSRHRYRAARGRSEEKDVQALTAAVEVLAVLTRKVCTALWCGLQMTLPQGASFQQAELSWALQQLCQPEAGAEPRTGDATRLPQGGAGGREEGRIRVACQV